MSSNMNADSEFGRNDQSQFGTSDTFTRNDGGGNPGQWDNSLSGQGKWEHRDDTDNTRGSNLGGNDLGGDNFTQQSRTNQGFDEYGSDTTGLGGQQRTGGPGATGIQSDRYDTSGQYGGPERIASDQTAGRADPDFGGDNNPNAGSGTASSGGKPSMTSKVMGVAEKMAGKMSGNTEKQARGQDRQEGNF
ncbi:hypothetical protein BC834DRAFT_967698 [Gloeopeniophorella convolvens]|nr:hypothetical protein BC834DRAFT_967698 [Gloeopeniophorella convolvens]